MFTEIGQVFKMYLYTYINNNNMCGFIGKIFNIMVFLSSFDTKYYTTLLP